MSSIIDQVVVGQATKLIKKLKKLQDKISTTNSPVQLARLLSEVQQETDELYRSVEQKFDSKKRQKFYEIFNMLQVERQASNSSKQGPRLAEVVKRGKS